MGKKGFVLPPVDDTHLCILDLEAGVRGKVILCEPIPEKKSN